MIKDQGSIIKDQGSQGSVHERICEEDREETSHCKADCLNLEKIVIIIKYFIRNIELGEKKHLE